MRDRLRLAIPNKGRLVDPTLALLHDAGLVFEEHDRSLVARVQNFDLDILFVRTNDIVEFVGDGVADLGVTGIDLLVEVMSLLRKGSWRVGNVAVQLVGNRPKLGPRRQDAEALLSDDGAVTGLQLRKVDDPTARPVTIASRAVVLATGGSGHLYAVTTNPHEASGQGLAIAARAGAIIADPEFVQFHPTAIMVGRDPAPLATEALRGEGATLINEAGERFMLSAHPLAELAPRDIVARGVFAEISAGRGAFLDAREALGARFAEKFPTVYASCLTAGLDPAKQPIPIAPAAHYHMGGIAVDAKGRTSLRGLWAGGEVASTGAHGANRLASNSLLEAVVFAARIAEDIGGEAIAAPAKLPRVLVVPRNCAMPALAEKNLREMMSSHVGVIRDSEGLAEAVRNFSALERETGNIALRNMATTALLVAASAWIRRESRGAHFRSDYPTEKPLLAHRTMTTLAAAREIAETLDVRAPQNAQPMIA